MITNQPELVPADWPECWLYYARQVSDGKAIVVQNQCGDKMRVEKNGDLTYLCTCGSTFRRAPGFQNEEARAWVIEHTPHLGAL